jgi:rod shape determining protein RodA
MFNLSHNNNMKRKYLILIPVTILVLISIIYLPNTLKIKQSIWLLSGLICYFLIHKESLKRVLKLANITYFSMLILLILVLIINKYTNGSRGWIDLKLISFQPSEFMKIALILMSLKYLNKINIWVFLSMYILPIILIFLEPDTGSIIAILIILSVFLGHKLAKKQIFKLLIIIMALIILGSYLYLNNQDYLIKLLGPTMFYRIDRIKSFLSNDNLQTSNALISVASGNTLYFPEMFNDFFVAFILSQNIYLIIPLIILPIIILIYLINKNTLIAQVVFYLFLWQWWWNLAMNLNLVPVIGIPYIFLSYGGTNLLSSFIMLSLAIISKGDNNKDMVDSKDDNKVEASSQD